MHIMTTIRSGAPRVASQPQATPTQPKTSSASAAATGYSEASSFTPAPSAASAAAAKVIAAAKGIVSSDQIPDGEVKDALKTFLEKPYLTNKDLEKGLGAFAALRDAGILSKEDMKTLNDAVLKRMTMKGVIDFASNNVKEMLQKLANNRVTWG